MKNLINEIKNAFIKQKREIYDSISKDYKENETTIEYRLLEKILEGKNIDEEKPGTILVIYNGNVYTMLEIVVKCLMQNKNIILVSNEEINHTKSLLLNIIQKVLKEKQSQLIVKEYNGVDISKVLEKNDLIDKIVYFGDKRKFRHLKQKTHIDIAYYGYGSINVYVDDEDLFENELFQIEEYAFDNNLYTYKFTEDIEEDIEEINKDGRNEICIILSQDVKKIELFKNNINSSNILVNNIDFETVKYEIPKELFSF